LSDLLARVVAGAWHIEATSNVDLLPAFGGFECSGACRSQHTIVLDVVRVATLILARAQSAVDLRVNEAFYIRTEELQAVWANLLEGRV